jgi:hypothetical protein
MKKSTVELIEKKFRWDIDAIDSELRKNKREINRLATRQRELKDIKKSLYEILRLIK